MPRHNEYEDFIDNPLVPLDLDEDEERFDEETQRKKLVAMLRKKIRLALSLTREYDDGDAAAANSAEITEKVAYIRSYYLENEYSEERVFNWSIELTPTFEWNFSFSKQLQESVEYFNLKKCALKLTSATMIPRPSDEIRREELLKGDGIDDAAAMPSKLRHYRELERIYKMLSGKENPFKAPSAYKKQIGCALYVCLTDENTTAENGTVLSEKRRKFVLANLNEQCPTYKLNLFFSIDYIENLTFYIKGRPYYFPMKSHVESVLLAGTFSFELPEDFGEQVENQSNLRKLVSSSIAKLIQVNGHIEKSKEIAEQKAARREARKAAGLDSDSDSDDEGESRGRDGGDDEDEKDESQKEGHEKEFFKKGVHVTEIFLGHGRKVRKGDRVSVQYKGRLDPEKRHAFDKTSLRHPFTFVVGSRKVLKGINIGVEGMTLHGKRELVIPPNKAFGRKGIPDKDIPPNATVYYDIELIDILDKEKPKEKRSDEY